MLSIFLKLLLFSLSKRSTVKIDPLDFSEETKILFLIFSLFYLNHPSKNVIHSKCFLEPCILHLIDLIPVHELMFHYS